MLNKLALLGAGADSQPLPPRDPPIAYIWDYSTAKFLDRSSWPARENGPFLLRTDKGMFNGSTLALDDVNRKVRLTLPRADLPLGLSLYYLSDVNLQAPGFAMWVMADLVLNTAEWAGYNPKNSRVSLLRCDAYNGIGTTFLLEAQHEEAETTYHLRVWDEGTTYVDSSESVPHDGSLTVSMDLRVVTTGFEVIVYLGTTELMRGGTGFPLRRVVDPKIEILRQAESEYRLLSEVVVDQIGFKLTPDGFPGTLPV